MTDRELMQQAQLEKLEGTLWMLNQQLTRKQAEIDALRERLAQPEQKRPPNCGTSFCSCIECVMKPEQPETVMAEYKFQTYAAYKTPDGEMQIGVVPETRPATREEKIVRPGVYEVPVEQEPVAWGMRDMNGHIYDCISTEEHARAEGDYNVPLYTTPPRREWVGLTDEEKLHLEIMGGKSDVMLAEAIEAKLKEKNA